jgi:leader peptidase (prepilin peptidase)/N-methyltransferase
VIGAGGALLAGIVADPALRRLAAGIPRRRWAATPDAPVGLLGPAAGLVAAALVLAADPAAVAITGVAVAPVIVLAAAIDLRWHRLPDRLTWPGALAVAVAAAIAALVDGDAAIAVRAAAGAGVMAGVLLVIHLVSPAGMGFGDVKLGLSLGLALGATAIVSTLVALFLAMVTGAVAGVVLVARHRDRRRAFAFGPCLGFGTVVALLVH